MIKPLTSWRGIFAVLIVMYHCHLQTGIAKGGVCFFLIVSGFLLSLRHDFATLDRAGYRRFVWSRAALVYPISWLALALLIALRAYVGKPLPDLPHLVSQLLLVQSFIPLRDYYLGYNAITWFLSSIMFCYLCFPLLRHWLSRVPVRRQVVMELVLMVLLAVTLSVASQPMLDYSLACPLMRLTEFFLGMVLANCFKAMNGKRFSCERSTATTIEVVTVALLLVFEIMYQVIPAVHNVYDYYIWDIPVALLVLVHALLNGSEGAVGRLLSTKPLTWLGGISLEVFMVQEPVFVTFGLTVCPIVAHFGFPQIYDFRYAFVPGMIVLCVVAWFLHRWFTIPVRRMCGRLV